MITFSAHPKSVRPLYTGVDPPHLLPRLLPHGGKRKRCGTSQSLSVVQVRSLVSGGAKSVAMGMPLNRFITVHWGARGLSDAQSSKATQKLLTRARDWLRDNGGQGVWIWVREYAIDQTKGAHLHWLIHLPETHRRQFLALLKKWVLASAGVRVYRAGVIQSRPIGVRVDDYLTSPQSHALNLRATLAYCLKGLVPQASKVAISGLDAIYTGFGAAMPHGGSGGDVSGKRAGVSRNLGKFTARA